MHGNYRRRYACSRHNPFNDGRGGQISLGGGHSIGRCELHRELVGYLEAAWKSHKELTSRVSQRRGTALVFAGRPWPGVAALIVSAGCISPMPSQRIRLCDTCRKREATCHLNEIVGDKIKSTDLCDECYAAREPLELKGSRRAAEATQCEYCGGRPCVDWHCLTNIAAFIVEPEQPRFLCSECSEEYNRLLEQALESLPEGLPESAQLTRLRTLSAQAHEHMLEWVRTRRS